MTSSGQVTIPEATPAEAPHSALTGPSGSLEILTARALKGWLQARRSVVEAMSREAGAAAFGAYRSAIVGDGGSGLCSDIEGAAVTAKLEPCRRSGGGSAMEGVRTGRRPLWSAASVCGSPAALE